MPTPTIPDGRLFMNATLYTGTGGTQTITNGAPGQSFQPDFVWIKERSSTSSHALIDSVRGVSNLLSSNTTDAEATGQVALTSFNTNGFSVGNDGKTNESPQTYVAWQWKAGGAAVTNTAGTISSQVSANTTAGFSVVTYTGTGANATVGHGLGVAPKMVIVKRRDGTSDWIVWQTALSGTEYLGLNLTNAKYTASPSIWNSTTPTSSVFSIGTSGATNPSGATMVAYCFAEVAGYSAFGSYTGNGSTDGTFVFTGFRPRFVMFKASSTTGDWQIFDTARNTYNVMDLRLDANASAAESTAANLDTLSNGFKLRTNSASVNGSGVSFVYMAFAENPLKFSNAR